MKYGSFDDILLKAHSALHPTERKILGYFRIALYIIYSSQSVLKCT